jgi:two-component sensor histidine kinase
MRIEKIFFLPRLMLMGILFIAIMHDAYSQTLVDTLQINKTLRRAELLVESNPDESDSLAQNTLVSSNKIDYKKGSAKSTFLIATNLRIANHNIPAIENYFTCLRYYQSINDSIMIHEIYKWLGLCLAFESYYDSGKVFIEKSISMAKKLGLTNSQAQAYLNLARLDKSQGLLKLAIADCENALELCDNNTNQDIKWKTENFLGYVYLLSNKQREAAQIINKNMAVYKKYLYMPVEVCRLIYYSSMLDLFLDNYKKVLSNQIESLKIADSIPNRNLSSYFKAMSYELIGKAYIKTEQYDSAKYYLFLAYNNPEYRLDLHAKGEILFNLADVYFYQHINDSALFFFNESAEIQAENKNPMYLCWSYLGMGKTYFQMKEYKLAEKYLLLAGNSDVLNENIEIKSATAELLSSIYLNKKDYEKAYKYHKIFKDASDELFNRDKIKQITQLELTNEFEDREQQLRYESQQEKLALELRLKQNKLTRNFTATGLVMAVVLLLLILKGYSQKKKSNSEKEILLKEIHHRVKNNLQIISSMLSLQGNYLSDQKIKDAVVESQGRVKSMALIHQMLYQHDRFSSIDIREYIGQLVGSISSSFNSSSKKISTELQVDQIWMDIDTAIPLGLIINELLTNAYKYAFPDNINGIVIVGLKRSDDGRFEFSVKDNGIGLPEKLRISKQSKTLGLNMVNILTRQLKGELQVIADKGTQYSIRFAELIKHQN